MINKNKTFQLISLFVLFTTVNVSFAADLISSIQDKKYAPYFEDAKGLYLSDSGEVIVSSERKGSIVRIKNKKISHQEINDEAFPDSDIAGIARLKNNNFVVVNNGSSNLAILDSDFKILSTMSGSGSDAGELDGPQGIAVSVNNRIYVADTKNHRISVFNSQGLFLYSFGDSEEGNQKLKKPSHIGLDASENIYVLESESSRISIFDRQGVLIKQVTPKDFKNLLDKTPKISAMTVDLNGIIYFADFSTRKIITYDYKTNKIVDSFGSLGQSQGQFRKVIQLAINTKSQLAIVDEDNEKVEIFQLQQASYKAPVLTDVLSFKEQVNVDCLKVYAFDNEKLLCTKDKKGIFLISNKGKELGQFAKEVKNPTDIHVGNTHVAVLEGNNLYAYTLGNEKIFKIGRYGIAPGGFDKPLFVYAIDSQTYVSEIKNNRVQVFSKDGQFLKQFKGGNSKTAFNKAGQIAVTNTGKLYIAENKGKGPITILDTKNGDRVGTLASLNEPYNFKEIYNIDVDEQGRLYVFAETDANPFSISVWGNNNVLMRVGSEEGNGIQHSFHDPSNMSVLSTTKNSILVNDTETKQLQIYDYQEIPLPAFGLKVEGNKNQVKLKWASAASKLKVVYEIEGSDSETGDFTKVATSDTLDKVFDASEVSNFLWFRVISVSGHGLKAQASKPKQNAYQEVAKLYQAKQYDTVIKKATKLLSLFPKNADLIYLRAKSLFITKEYRDSIAAFQPLTAVAKYKHEALKTQVQAYFDLEEYLDAKALIDEVLATGTSDVQPYLICTELSLVLSDAIGAVTCAEDGLEKNVNHTKLRFLLGKAYIAAGISDQGLSEFETILAAKPNDQKTRILIANELYKLALYEESLLLFDEVERALPSSFEAKNGKAKVLIALERYDEAKSLAIALSGNKKSIIIQSDGYYFLGQIAFKNKNFTEAVLRLTRAGKYNENATGAWALLAQSYIELNQLPKGVRTLNQGIKKNPEAFELYETLGQIELAQSHFPEANKALLKAVELNPSSLISQKLLAKSLFSTRDYRNAATHAKQAARIAPKDVDVLVLQADIASLQGKVGSAIEHLKTALSVKPSSADLNYRLGRIYQDANLYDSSKSHLEKAAGINPSWADPHVALGNLYIKRRLFDQAIAAYEKGIELDPSEDNRAALNVAFAEQKRALDFSNNAPQLVLQDLNINHVFSAAYKKYTTKPIGSITLENVGATDFGNLTLSFQIKEFMDFPQVQKIPLIKGSSKQTFDIKAIFNNKILQVDEDTGVQVEVKVSYLRDGQKDDIILTQAMTIYGKNAMMWGDALMVGSFVTPKDDSLRNFVREVVNKYQPDPGPLNDKLVTAMSYFSSLNAHGTKYIVDPNTPYSSLRDDQVDYVQFPRETLRLKSGDCDDLSVLYSAGLENLGINTALLEVPGHLLMMFDTGLSIDDSALVSRDNSLLAVRDGRIWIPVEATMISNSFSEAWAEGARKYQKAVAENNLGIIALSEAWAAYKPVTLQKSDNKIELPNDSQAKKLIKREKKILLSKSIDRLILPYQAMVAGDPRNTVARMQIAILYSRFGLFDEAEQAYDELLELAPRNISVLNNKANYLLLQEKYDDAITVYKQAESIAPNDAHVKLNISMAYYSKGQIKNATSSFRKAIALEPSIKSEFSAFSKLLSQ
ncbi:MAG: tetratricopeptide repeat protein [Gammaproteobacteria bacterium]|nr:tetratricopeptide repeat protein [Gammaproteobacteria bacterium]